MTTQNKSKLFVIGNWWVIPQRRVAVAVPMKCGSTSFYRSAFRVTGTIEDRNVFNYLLHYRHTRGPFSYTAASKYADEMYLAFRGPVARFASLWRDKCRDTTHETASNRNQGLYYIIGATPERLISYIQANPEQDAHWLPQSRDMRAGVKLVRYDRILHVLGLPPVLCNSTEVHDDDATMPVQNILDHYSADVALWNQVNEDG